MGTLDTDNLLKDYSSKIKCIGNQHPKLKEYKQLLKRNTSKKLLAIEGICGHERAIKAEIEIKVLFICPDKIYSIEALELVRSCIDKAEEVYEVSNKILSKISDRDSPDGIFSIGVFPEYSIKDIVLSDDSRIIILDGLETPGNIGTILRTCEGAGVDAVFICNKKTPITNPKVIKASTGAAFFVPIIEFSGVEECIEYLSDNNVKICLADPRGEKHYFQYEYTGRVAIVVGNERYGLSSDWYTAEATLVSIPMNGRCDSLNVSIASSIIIYEMCVKQRLNIGGWSNERN